MRRAQARKGRHEIDAAIVLHALGQSFDLGRGLDDAEPVAQPLNRRAGDEHAAFKRVFRAAVDLPGDRCKQIVLRWNRLLARVHEHEAAGAVGVLHHARIGAHLTEERGLLIAGDARDGNAAAEQAGLAVDFTGGADLGQHGFGNIENLQQLLVPTASLDVVEHGARGVADVGDVARAIGQLPDQPRINRPEGELALLLQSAGAFDVVQDPLNFGPGEIGVDDQPRLAANERRVLFLLQPIASRGGASILPDDGVANGFTGVAIPDDDGLALVGDANPGDFIWRGADLLDGSPGDRELARPDGLGVMLHPARFGENLGKLLLRDGDNGAALVEQYSA